MEGLTPGRIVHYVATEKDALAVNDFWSTKGRISGNPLIAGAHMPMIITAVFPDEFGQNQPGVNGQVFLDGSETIWVTSLRYSDKKEPGSWHWIEKA